MKKWIEKKMISYLKRQGYQIIDCKKINPIKDHLINISNEFDSLHLLLKKFNHPFDYY